MNERKEIYEEQLTKDERLEKERKITLYDLREHITGPVLSTIIHIIIIAFLGTLLVYKKPEKPKDELEVDVVKVKKTPEIKKKIELPPDPNPIEDKVDVKIPRPEVETEKVDVEIKEITFKSSPVKIKVPNVLNIKPTLSKLPMPSLIKSRDALERAKSIEEHGGDDTTEKAVLQGLRWLKDHQNPDGSWGDTAKSNFAAYTGMALLAFLGHNETTVSPEFGLTVKKAIMKLSEMVGTDGKGVKGGYRHGIAMYALAEAYTLTKISMLKPILNNGIKRIVDGINSDGSYNYGYNNSKGRSDLSVAGWNYQALKAAFTAGCEVEGLQEAMEKAKNIGLKRTHYNSGSKMFCYGKNSGAKTTMTAVGVLCLQLYNDGKSTEAQEGLKTLEMDKNFWFSWDNNPNSDHPMPWSLYQWYYQTQAVFQGHSGKGKIWEKWNKIFSNELVNKQKTDGRWESPMFEHDPAKGGHGEQMMKGLDQPVYSTSLCCLMLEVYYRYLPTFTIHKVEKSEDDNAESEDDLGLSIKESL